MPKDLVTFSKTKAATVNGVPNVTVQGTCAHQPANVKNCHRRVYLVGRPNSEAVPYIGTKCDVEQNRAYKTGGGLVKNDIVTIKTKCVSKKMASRRGVSTPWSRAMQGARKRLGITGFAYLRGEYLRVTKEIYYANMPPDLISIPRNTELENKQTQITRLQSTLQELQEQAAAGAEERKTALTLLSGLASGREEKKAVEQAQQADRALGSAWASVHGHTPILSTLATGRTHLRSQLKSKQALGQEATALTLAIEDAEAAYTREQARHSNLQATLTTTHAQRDGALRKLKSISDSTLALVKVPTNGREQANASTRSKTIGKIAQLALEDDAVHTDVQRLTTQLAKKEVQHHAAWDTQQEQEQASPAARLYSIMLYDGIVKGYTAWYASIQGYYKQLLHLQAHREIMADRQPYINRIFDMLEYHRGLCLSQENVLRADPVLSNSAKVHIGRHIYQQLQTIFKMRIALFDNIGLNSITMLANPEEWKTSTPARADFCRASVASLFAAYLELMHGLKLVKSKQIPMYEKDPEVKRIYLEETQENFKVLSSRLSLFVSQMSNLRAQQLVRELQIRNQ